MNHKGRYVNTREDKQGNLILTYVPRSTNKQERARFLDLSEESALWELLEDIICNSELEFVRPEEIGALTDAPILSDTATRDDHGDITDIDYVWVYWDYATDNPVEDLFDGKEVIFFKEPCK